MRFLEMRNVTLDSKTHFSGFTEEEAMLHLKTDVFICVSI